MNSSSSRSFLRPFRTLLVVLGLTGVALPAFAAKLDAASIGKAAGVDATA